MALYLIKLTGSYAIEAQIVRAPSLAQAMALAKVEVDALPFNKAEVSILSEEGEEGVLDTITYIE